MSKFKNKPRILGKNPFTFQFRAIFVISRLRITILDYTSNILIEKSNGFNQYSE